MKTIGFIGGLTWHSSIDYYRLFNEMVNERLSGAHSCRMLMYSVDFEEIKTRTLRADWEGVAGIIVPAAVALEKAGAECMVLGANTMHNIADEVQGGLSIPVIHIAAATAAAIEKQQLQTVALLGTRFTMQMDFYTGKLAEKNIRALIPGEEDIDYINHAIYEEMSIGIFSPETKGRIIQIINDLKQQGAQGVILGCTELPILVKQQDVSIPIFDTTLIHAMAAVEFALQ